MNATSAPRWLLWVGIAALLWNLIGVWSFVSNWQMSNTGYAGLPEVQRTLWSSMPLWTWIGFALAVGCGTSGAVALLARKALAVPLFLISFIAVLIQFSWPIFMTDAFSKMGAELVTFPIILAVVGAFEWHFTRVWRSKGWLR
jgi:hypothetical protein